MTVEVRKIEDLFALGEVYLPDGERMHIDDVEIIEWMRRDYIIDEVEYSPTLDPDFVRKWNCRSFVVRDRYDRLRRQSFYVC